MNNDLNRKIEEAQQGMLRLQKIKSMLSELNTQKISLTKKVSALKTKLEMEELDVDKLEGKSISHLFHTILGKFDVYLEKERKEALEAQLKYNQAVRDLETIKDQVTNLYSEMSQYESCAGNYHALYKMKKEMLLKSGSNVADKILMLSDQINIINNHIKEIIEAINAGYKVISHLDSAIDSLKSAENWGTWDMLGGGLLTDIVKHSRIDGATNEVEESQKALLQFRTELADVRITNNIGIEISEFSNFADFFFDGLIADWNMQSKIEKSLENVTETRNQVQLVLSKLKSMKNEDALQVEQLEKKMSELIIQA